VISRNHIKTAESAPTVGG